MDHGRRPLLHVALLDTEPSADFDVTVRKKMYFRDIFTRVHGAYPTNKNDSSAWFADLGSKRLVLVDGWEPVYHNTRKVIRTAGGGRRAAYTETRGRNSPVPAGPLISTRAGPIAQAMANAPVNPEERLIVPAGFVQGPASSAGPAASASADPPSAQEAQAIVPAGVMPAGVPVAIVSGWPIAKRGRRGGRNRGRARGRD